MEGYIFYFIHLYSTDVFYSVVQKLALVLIPIGAHNLNSISMFLECWTGEPTENPHKLHTDVVFGWIPTQDPRAAR